MKLLSRISEHTVHGTRASGLKSMIKSKFWSQSLFLDTGARTQARRSLSLTSRTPEAAKNNGGGPIKKPNLKKSSRPFGPRSLVPVACLLAAIYMYPMIFKPLFGIGEEHENPREKLEALKKSGLDPSVTRPSNMPEWTSPFAPKSDK